MAAASLSDTLSNAGLLQRRQENIPHGIVSMFPVFIERGENAEVWDVEGKRYIDFAGGIGTLNVGHRHPRVVAAVKAQADRVMHTAFQVAAYEPYILLAEKLNHLAPISPPNKSICFSTGAEALENAVKIARIATKRRGVISFTGGFHGRSMLALALTGKVLPYKKGFGPLPGDVYHAPFPIALHGISIEESIKGIQRIFKTQIEPEEVAAIVFEPNQGEGGFYIAPTEWIQEVRKICDEYGILLVSDEVQSGFARTGKLFAIEHSGVQPDLIVCAKSLAGGMPLSAIIGRAEIMDSVPPGGLGGTYSGNPMACAAGLAVLEVIEQENLLQKSMELGSYLKHRLGQLAKKFPQIGEVRGLGGMVAMEFIQDGRPLPNIAKELSMRSLENGLLLLPCGIYGNVSRILVPITAEKFILEKGCSIISSGLEKILPK